MTGIGVKVSDYKRKQIIKLSAEGLPTSIIAERLGLHASQVIYHQKVLGIWRGEKRK